MKNFLLFLFAIAAFTVAIFLSVTVRAQVSAKQWDKRYGGTASDVPNKIIQIPGGGYLFAGYSDSPRSGNKSQKARHGSNDYWILRTDSAGHKVWDLRYGGTRNDFLTTALLTPDGGYLLGGYSFSRQTGDKSQPRIGIADFWIVKTDMDGNKEWDATFGGSKMEVLNSICLTSDSMYLLAGYTNSDISGDQSQNPRGGYDYWILKVNKQGQKIWDKRFGGSGDDYLQNIEPSLDHGFLLGGSSYSNASGEKTQNSFGAEDFWIVKIDSNGNYEWDKAFGGTSTDQLYDEKQLMNRNFLLGGFSASPVSGNKTTASLNDFWLVMTDSLGNKIWDKSYGGNPPSDYLAAIAIEPNGEFLLAGTSNSNGGNDKTQNVRGHSDYWLVNINSEGVKTWDADFGASQYDALRAMIATSDSGAMLIGQSNSDDDGDKSQPSQGDYDFWAVKVGKPGTIGDSIISFLQPAHFEQGDPITIPYATIGVFDEGNQFTAQLSDNTGNFSNPITLGAVNSSSGGIISGTIPGNTLDGAGYLVRVVSSNPSIASAPTNIGVGCTYPAGLNATNITANSAKLHWSQIGDYGYEAYIINYKKTLALFWFGFQTFDTTFTISNLSPSSEYVWKISAYCTSSYSLYSPDQYFTTAELRGQRDQDFSAGIFPNPFSSSATINFSLNQPSQISVKLYSIDGKEMMTIAEQNFAEGNHQINLDGELLLPGIYFLKIKTSSEVFTKKIVLIH